MHYDVFLECMLSEKRTETETWKQLCAADVVMGGIRLDTDIE